MPKQRQYWLGVIRTLSLEEHLWWCLPSRAAIGDRIFMYCPRSAKSLRYGVFAECELTTAPYSNPDERHRCSMFGRRTEFLGYAELKVVRLFKETITSQQMKRDALLRQANFVRRSFQGTTFAVTHEVAARIVALRKR